MSACQRVSAVRPLASTGPPTSERSSKECWRSSTIGRPPPPRCVHTSSPDAGERAGTTGHGGGEHGVLHGGGA
jgi:hypothetical protein